MPFKYPNSISLAQLPTPILKLERFSRFVEGPEIYLKRDDCTGLGLTGNKVRKLEFLMAEALDKQADCVITCGGSQSNHARTTAIASARLGMKCHLVLRNNMGAALEGNLFINRLVGAEIHYITPEEYMAVDDVMMRLAQQLEEKGHKPYIIPEGGSNDLGTMGYVRAAEEISNQFKASSLRPDCVIVSVGSGGTYAGLLMGKFLFDISADIYGINICDNEGFFVKKIYKVIQDAQKRFDLPLTITKKDIKIIDGYVGKGYGLSSQDELDMIKRVASSEGVLLDPVYTGKAMLGLVDQVRNGKLRDAKRILFIHTGGIFGIFSKRSLFF